MPPHPGRRRRGRHPAPAQVNEQIRLLMETCPSSTARAREYDRLLLLWVEAVSTHSDRDAA